MVKNMATVPHLWYGESGDPTHGFLHCLCLHVKMFKLTLKLVHDCCNLEGKGGGGGGGGGGGRDRREGGGRGREGRRRDRREGGIGGKEEGGGGIGGKEEGEQGGRCGKHSISDTLKPFTKSTYLLKVHGLEGRVHRLDHSCHCTCHLQ